VRKDHTFLYRPQDAPMLYVGIGYLHQLPLMVSVSHVFSECLGSKTLDLNAVVAVDDLQSSWQCSVCCQELEHRKSHTDQSSW